MNPSEVRERILTDHARLQKRMQAIEAQIEQQDPVAELQREVEWLVEELVNHMLWEDFYLGRALEEADAWGDARRAELSEEHSRQREWIKQFLRELHNPQLTRAAMKIQLEGFFRDLRRDMQDEETHTLDPNVLRDDIVGIDVEAG